MVETLDSQNGRYSPRDCEIFASGLDHPESLAFDDTGVMWAGGEAGQLYRISPEGVVDQVAVLGGLCLGITVSAAQDLWVCNAGLRSLMHVDRGGNVLQSVTTVAGRKLINPNHSVFDHLGNMYFTDSGTWDDGNGYIYRLGLKGNEEIIGGPFHFPNGIALSDDGRSLFVAESQTDSVLRLVLDASGCATATERYADGLARIPDGIILDSRGNLYVMCYASDAIYCVSPQGKTELLIYDREATRLARPTNAAFGGPNHDDLYIANFGRWHVGRLHIGVAGQRLNNMRKRG